jgi:hypothetical protein
VVFYPATEADWTVLPTTRHNLNQLKPQPNQPFFRGLSVRAGAVTDGLLFIYDSITRKADITWADHSADSTKSISVSVYGTESGVSFEPPINMNGIIISNLVYNGSAFTPNIADGLTGELAYSDVAPFPFYNSFNELLANANGCGIPLFGGVSGDLLSMLMALTYSSHFSPSLGVDVSMSMIMNGLRQFALSMRSPISTTGRQGMWLTYRGAATGMGAATDYYLDAIEPIWIGDDGDKAILGRVRVNPEDPDSEYLSYTTSSVFQSRMGGVALLNDMRMFFTNPAGFTVVPSADNKYYFVSLENSRDWVLLDRN